MGDAGFDSGGLAARTEALVALLHRRGSDGERLYTRAEVQHALAVLFLPLSGDPAVSLPQPAKLLVAELAVLAGVGPEAPRDEAHARLTRFLERFPPNPQLMSELVAFMRENLGGSDRRAAAELSRLLGEPGPDRRVPVPTRKLDWEP